MSGIRENTRSAKRSRPSDAQPRMAPPVLFRLPSVGVPNVDASSSSVGINASTMNAGAMAMPMSAPAQAMAAPVATAAPMPSASPTAAERTAASAIAEEKAAGQRLLNVLIVLLLLAALVVITWISLNTPSSSGDVVKATGDSTLEQLGDLKVPNVQTGQAVPAHEVVEKTPTSASVGDLTSGLSLTPDQSIQPTPNAQPESLIAGLDTDVKDSSAATATKPATPSAQVQLRPPVPMGTNTGSLVQQLTPNDTQKLDLSLPSATRAETVSTPASNSITTGPGLEFTEPTPSLNTQTEPTQVDKPRTATNSGASPSLWDGAQNVQAETQLSTSVTSTPNTPSPTRTSGLIISDPLSAQVAVPPGSSASGSSSGSNTTTDTQHTAQSAGQTAVNGSSSTGSTDQAVTVGGGASEPYNLATTRTTSTPDFDSVSTIQQYQNYAQQQRLSTRQVDATANAAAPAPVAPTTKQPINSFAIGADTGISGQKPYQNPYVKGSAPNSYVASGQIPGGVTGVPSGAYVPVQTPSTAPSGQQPVGQVPGQMVSAPGTVPATLPGYQLPPNNAAPSAGYSVPPRSQPANSAFGQPGAGYPGGSGYPNTSYPTPSYQNPGYQNLNNQNPSYQNPGYQNPSYPAPGASAAPTMAGGVNPNAAGYRAAPAYMPSGVQGSASYPVTNPYPAGQVQPSLMGPTGYATAPSGDFAPPRPVTGTMGSAVSLPNGIQ